MKSIPHQAIHDIVWMARRYADRRSTYAPSMFNDAYDSLRSHGYIIETEVNDTGICKIFPYAEDGSPNIDEEIKRGVPRKYTDFVKVIDHFIEECQKDYVPDKIPKKDLLEFLKGLKERII